MSDWIQKKNILQIMPAPEGMLACFKQLGNSGTSHVWTVPVVALALAEVFYKDDEVEREIFGVIIVGGEDAASTMTLAEDEDYFVKYGLSGKYPE